MLLKTLFIIKLLAQINILKGFNATFMGCYKIIIYLLVGFLLLVDMFDMYSVLTNTARMQHSVRAEDCNYMCSIESWLKHHIY